MNKEKFEYPLKDKIGSYCFRTLGGKRVKIYERLGVSESMKLSGKFPNGDSREKSNDIEKKKEYNTIESFNCLKKYQNMNDEEFKKSYTSKNDYIMEDMAKENGFNKLPTKVAEKEYDGLIRDGHIRIQRVVSDDINNTAEYYANEFKNGNYFATGNANQYGNGIYTSANLSDIDTYSYRGKNSTVIEMAIDKNAKIITFKNQQDIFNYTVNELKKIDLKYERILQEPGKILVSKGYDACYIEDKNYYIIYNRGKIYVKE